MPPAPHLTDLGRETITRLIDKYSRYDRRDELQAWKKTINSPVSPISPEWTASSGYREVSHLPTDCPRGKLIANPRSRYVLKVDIDPSFISCWQEALIWKQAAYRDAADLFAPIIAFGTDSCHDWVIMEEVPALQSDSHLYEVGTPPTVDKASDAPKTTYPARNSYQARLAEHDLYLTASGVRQLGYRNEEVVAFDYEHIKYTGGLNDDPWVGALHDDIDTFGRTHGAILPRDIR
jgi:hypothetical protein